MKQTDFLVHNPGMSQRRFLGCSLLSAVGLSLLGGL